MNLNTGSKLCDELADNMVDRHHKYCDICSAASKPHSELE